MTEPFRVAIAGLGTVGAGVVEILQSNAAQVAMRAGRPVEIVAVNARDKAKERGVDVSAYEWVDDAAGLAGVEADAVIELIGGSDGPAYDLVKAALAGGKHVVSANKALLAHHGTELATLAEGHGVSLNYEAAVAGGIPIIKAAREGLAGNKMSAVYGILNGTSNFILTKMRESGRDFDDVLKEAQDLGYAEADPTFDVDGVDAGHKICLLASIAFGVQPEFNKVRMRGIREVTSADINFAAEFGYRIKLLGIAKDRDGLINITVEPCLVPEATPLGTVENAYNAVVVKGDFVDTPLLTGLGAGRGPTASAVVADIIDLARGLHVPTFGIPAKALKKPDFIDPATIKQHYYLRLTVTDQPGVIADVSAILRDHDASIESMVQHGRDPGQPVSVVLVTHDVKRGDIEAACEEISKLKSCLEKPYLMRIEHQL
ncbi:MAG: homoserine dehydrogenase [Alphaproteobacteria bacterium]|nr:homoserine dehydrogenase [Alphaproteobacteria bacterium]